MRTTSILLLLIACTGDDEGKTSDSGDTMDTMDTMDTVDTVDTNDTTPTGGFLIDATAIDFGTQLPVAAGLCVDLIDPSPAVAGGAAKTLATTKVGTNGAFQFADVVPPSTIGLLLSVKDCGATGTTVYTTATGILGSTYENLGAGDTLPYTAFSIDNATLAGFEASAAALGYAGDLSTDGFMLGLVITSASAPIGGATVTCADCLATWYLDADPTDGAFSTAGAANTATDPLVGAFLIAAAPIGVYTAENGGVNTFGDQLNGSNPGSAVFTAFIAE